MIPFFGMLLKGRKSEGPLTAHRPVAVTPDGALKVQISAPSSVIPGLISPPDLSGETLWLNTNPGMEGIYFYDLTRSKWLETSIVKYSWGEDSADNRVLAVTGVNSAGTGTGYGVLQNQTIVGVQAHARGGNTTKGFDVRKNAAGSLFSFNLSARHFANMALDVDVVGGATDFLDVFAVSAGGATSDVAVDVYMRRHG